MGTDWTRPVRKLVTGLNPLPLLVRLETRLRLDSHQRSDGDIQPWSWIVAWGFDGILDLLYYGRRHGSSVLGQRRFGHGFADIGIRFISGRSIYTAVCRLQTAVYCTPFTIRGAIQYWVQYRRGSLLSTATGPCGRCHLALALLTIIFL